MKEEILNKASQMFLSKGFKSITMDDIAQNMGISKKTIYTHFPKKEIIVNEVTSHIFEEVCKGIDTICSKNYNPIEELYEIKKHVMLYLNDEKVSPTYQLQKYYPHIHANLKKNQFQFMRGCVTNNLNRGLKEGLFRENIEVDFVARIYFIGVTGIKDEELFPPSLFDNKTLHEHYLEYHLRGIVTPKGRKILNQIIHSNLD